MTAHFLGGCTIGRSAADGVVDPYHRVFGHPGLHVVDGSTVSANLGVNPSLTIVAQAERAFALWPNAGEPDPRPAPGEPYVRLAPVRPRAAGRPRVGAGGAAADRALAGLGPAPAATTGIIPVRGTSAADGSGTNFGLRPGRPRSRRISMPSRVVARQTAPPLSRPSGCGSHGTLRESQTRMVACSTPSRSARRAMS